MIMAVEMVAVLVATVVPEVLEGSLEVVAEAVVDS